MAQSTQRLRYYDGEFLRSGDFTDEQSYHIAMRRLLNQQLGLSGIVSGVHIHQDQNSVPPLPSQPLVAGTLSTAPLSTGAEFYSVMPGFVIDQLGRAIYVSAPTSLTPLLDRAGVKEGLNELWIVYTETPTGSPAPGYQLCNQVSQNTRWTESFDLILRSLTVSPDPNAPNPNLDLKGICLGIVTVKSGSLGPYITLPQHWWHRRHYARIRAQSIIAPDDVDLDSFTFYGPVSPPQVFPPPPPGYVYIKTPNGVYSDGNMLVQNNMLIGDDFVLDNTQANSKNLPSALPSPSGNLKVAGDLFLQGQLWDQNGGNWRSLDDFVKNLSASPVIQFTTGSTTSFTTPTTQTVSGTVVAAIAKFSNVVMQASIRGLTFVANQTAAASKPAVNFTTLTQPTPQSGVKGDSVTFSVDCSVSGGPGSLIDGVEILFIVVFQP
jgi:hypothetical protein